MNNTLTLRSGRNIVAEGDVNGIVEIVKKLQTIRNTNAYWIDIATPWRVIENVLSASALIRNTQEYIDPFARLSVYRGNKKLISVWT